MPPPGSNHGKGGPGLMIAIGVPKRGADSDRGGRMSPPGTPSRDPGGKVSAEEAALVLDNAHCIDCTMYHPDSGECDKVEGTLSPQDGCYNYFNAIKGGGEDEPDADDQGGPSDNDADDRQSGMSGMSGMGGSAA